MRTHSFPFNTTAVATKERVDSPEDRQSARRFHPAARKSRLFRIAFASLAAIAVVSSLVVADAPRASAAACNDTKWTWPFCHLHKPSIPRFNAPGRPPLTPKDSAWCRNSFVPTSTSTVYWYLDYNQKHTLRLWPDYYERTYTAIYWNETRWGYLYPLQQLFIDCDA